MKKQPIIISIPLVWSVRNTINSGFLDLLSRQFEIYVAVPSTGVEDMLKLGITASNLIKLEIPKSTRTIRIITAALKNTHRGEKGTESDKIFGNWYKIGKPDASNTRNISLRFLEFFLNRKSGFSAVENFLNKQYAHQFPREQREIIRRIYPVAALSTCYVSNWEWPLFNFLQDLQIPTATHILSFDNLTSRGYIPMGRFDRYFTWQSTMGSELVNFCNIDNNKIRITGTPQFNFHIKPSLIWDRQTTAANLGIDPKLPYIAYCANHHKHTPREMELIKNLAEITKLESQFRNFQWVIRLHPMDKFIRWEPLIGKYSNIHISHPWEREDSDAYWASPSSEQIALLGNTLRHAVATVNVASTVSLDSCVVDTPVICVGFHPDKGSEEDHYYRNVHFTHHYAPIATSKAVSFVQNTGEFLQALASAVHNRSEKSNFRDVLKKQICGNVDGRSHERIASEIVAMVNNKIS